MHWLYDKYLVTVIDRNNAVIQSTSPTGHHGVVDACAKCGQIIAGKSSRLRAISQSIVGQLIRVAQGSKEYFEQYQNHQKAKATERSLLRLSDYQLRDIGMTRDDLTELMYREKPLGQVGLNDDHRYSIARK